ncbi:MAG: GNAT family N-acetyltransferase [Bauldia sp.]
MDIATLTSDRELTVLADEWRALERRALAATPFASHQWIALCWAMLRARGNCRLSVVTARAEGRLVFVLPLVARRDFPGWRTLGWIDSGTPCYADLVMEDSAAGRSGAEAAAAFLKRDFSIRRMRLNWVPEDAAARHFLRASGAQQKTRFPVRRLYTGDYGDWDEFLRRMTARSRQNFRNRLRALEKLGTLSFDKVGDPAEAVSETALLLSRKRAALASGLKRAHWLLAADVEQLFRAAAAAGVGTVDRLAVDGKSLASTFVFRSQEGIYLSKTAFDAAFSKYAPGRVCRLLLVKYAFENGVAFIDLMTGQFAWKVSMSSRQTSCANYRVPGRLFAFLPP